MTVQYKTQAFVFKKNDRNESDRFFSVFTDDFGRLDIFAKAIRKINSKLRKDVDIFYLSEIEFIQGKSHKTLIDANNINKFGNITKDFKKLKIVYKVSELLDSFIKGQEKDTKTFNLLTDFLGKLGEGSDKMKSYQLAYQYFFWNFMDLQGYKLEVNNCIACRSKLAPDNIYFSGKEGGIICSRCFKSDVRAKRINADIIKVLRIILSKDWELLLKLKIEESSQKLLYIISEKAILAFCPS